MERVDQTLWSQILRYSSRCDENIRRCSRSCLCLLSDSLTLSLSLFTSLLYGYPLGACSYQLICCFSWSHDPNPPWPTIQMLYQNLTFNSPTVSLTGKKNTMEKNARNHLYLKWLHKRWGKLLVKIPQPGGGRRDMSSAEGMTNEPPLTDDLIM